MVKPPRRKGLFSQTAAAVAAAGAALAARGGTSSGTFRSVATAKRGKRPAQYRRKRGQKGENHAIVSGQGAITRFNRYANKLNLSQKVIMGMTGINAFEFNGAGRLQSSPGTQCATSMLQCDYAPLAALYNQLPGGLNSSKRLFLQDVYFEYAVTNVTNAVTNLDIYDVNYKREMDSTDLALQLPDGAWNGGEKQEGNTSGYTLLGSYPTRIDAFKQYYTVANKESHMLAPGDVHRHKIHNQIRKFVTFNRIGASTRYAGLTTASMLVASGTPVDNSGNTTGFFDPAADLPNSLMDASGNLLSNVTGGTVTTSPVALDFTWRARYVFRWASDTDSTIQFSNNMVSEGNFEAMQNTGIKRSIEFT